MWATEKRRNPAGNPCGQARLPFALSAEKKERSNGRKGQSDPGHGAIAFDLVRVLGGLDISCMGVPGFEFQPAAQEDVRVQGRRIDVGEQVDVHAVLDLVDVAGRMCAFAFHVVDGQCVVQPLSQSRGIRPLRKQGRDCTGDLDGSSPVAMTLPPASWKALIFRRLLQRIVLWPGSTSTLNRSE